MMKKFASFLVTALFAFTAIVPFFAQSKIVSKVPKLPKAYIEFGEVSPVSDGNGVMIRWETVSELNTFGFHVYRTDEKGGRQLVNDRMVGGSALKLRDEPFFAEKYELFDRQGNKSSNYVIEAILLDGTRTRKGPFSPKSVSQILSSAGRTSSELSHVRENSSFAESSKLSLSGDLEKTVSLSSIVSDPVTQRWVAAQAGVKIGVRAEGLYRVTKSELQTAGFDTATDSSFWRLFVNGVEVPIIVGPNANYVEFLGKGIDTIESDTQYYYLVGGNITGKRMGSRVARQVGYVFPSKNFTQSVDRKQRILHDETIINGDAENYFGNNVIPGFERTIQFNLGAPDPDSGNASFTIRLQGANDINHSVSVLLNGQNLSAVNGNGAVNYSRTYSIPVSYLRDGVNTMVLSSTAGPIDFNYFDSVSVSYSRKYRADSNSLKFLTQSYKSTQIRGFTSQNVRLFDVTSESDPLQVSNLKVEQNGQQFDVLLPAHRSGIFYAVEDSAVLQSPSIIPNNPSTLSDPKDAKLVLVTYGDFLTQANAWAAYRRGQGITAEVVDIADIYDEYNFGTHGAAPITAFLNHARNDWQTQYVLLLGDATYDPRNYENTGFNDLIPTKTVNGQYTEIESDEALTDFNGDGLSDLAIGRIPVRTGQAVTNALNKVIAFEADANRVNRGVLFAYDKFDFIYDFRVMSEQLENQLLPAIPTTSVARGLPPPNDDQNDPAAHTNLVNALNSGKLIANYTGHGATGAWGGTDFFAFTQISELTNSNSQTIFTMLTCLNGKFTMLNNNNDSLGEGLLKSTSGGGVAAWASTGKTNGDVQVEMATRFFNQVRVGNITRLGDLIKDAKAVVPFGLDVRYSWVLLGDPMLKVRP